MRMVDRYNVIRLYIDIFLFLFFFFSFFFFFNVKEKVNVFRYYTLVDYRRTRN